MSVLGEQEKRSAALTSLVASILLTSLKILVGVATGSLGVLAEAAHSGLDFLATAVTYIAVRIANKPADSSHHYGHGKVENLSALFETLLLLATCGWIIYAAVVRLVSGVVHVEANVWSFVVMIASMFVDSSRAFVLKRAARKHSSQALEADALHFETDIWSSGVVIIGLAGLKLAQWFPALSWLRHADAFAALCVALLVIGVCFRMGMRSINELMDSAPEGLEVRIKAAAESVPGVRDCHHVRVRVSGSQIFVDIHILVDGEQSVTTAHRLADDIEARIGELEPRADVTVHPEPFPDPALGAEVHSQ